MVTYACIGFIHLLHTEKMRSETPHQLSYCIGPSRPDVSGPIRSVKMYSCVNVQYYAKEISVL
jgi:hypothetical protein